MLIHTSNVLLQNVSSQIMFVNTFINSSYSLSNFNELQISSNTFAKDFDNIVVLSSFPILSNGILMGYIIQQ